MKIFKSIVHLKEFLIKNRKLIMFILIILLIFYIKIFFTTGLYFNETFLKKTVANDVIYYQGSNKQGDISITIKGDVHHDSIAEISYNLPYNNHEEYIVGYIDASSWNAGVNSITNKNGDVLFEGTYLWNRLDFYDKNGNYLLEENKLMPSMVSYNEEGYIIPLVNIAQIAMLKNETIRGNLVILFLAFIFFIKTILDIKYPLFMFKISTWPMVKDPQPTTIRIIFNSAKNIMGVVPFNRFYFDDYSNLKSFALTLKSRELAEKIYGGTMRVSRKTIQIILIIFLSFSLFMLFSKYDSMQKGVDQVFFNAISNSTSVIAKDYSKLSNDEKIRSYYQTVNGLKTALDTFHLTSYKEHEGIFQVLNELYIYLLIYDNEKDDYEIEDGTYIYDTIWKMVWQPENEELVKEFDKFIDDKKKILYNN